MGLLCFVRKAICNGQTAQWMFLGMGGKERKACLLKICTSAGGARKHECCNQLGVINLGTVPVYGNPF